MRLKVYHRTEYSYANAVINNSNEVRLSPKLTPYQQVETNFISVLPATRLTGYTDLNFNRVHRFNIPQPHQQLTIDSRFTVKTKKPFEIDSLPYGYTNIEVKKCSQYDSCHTYLQDSSFVEKTPHIWREALDIQAHSTDVFQTCSALMDFIYSDFTYASGATQVTTHASEVIKGRTGVCQDFAHAMTAYCRSLGIPARYVSGYFFDSTRDQNLRGSEASHAWVEVYLGQHGWVGLDPTNRKVVDDTYVVLAYGRDYRDVAPVIGSYFGGGGSHLTIRVKVESLGTKTAGVF